MFLNNSKITQTDCSFSSFTSSHHLAIEQQQQLTADIDELARTKSDTQHHFESTMETIKRCLTMTRSLLIEKSQLEKKQARQKAMENRLRLGQFVTQRQGTSFVEQWIDGYDFLDKQRAQEQLARVKENLDRERKNLAKKKTLFQQQYQQQMMLTATPEETMTHLTNFPCQEFTHSVTSSPSKNKRTNKMANMKTLNRYITLEALCVS